MIDGLRVVEGVVAWADKVRGAKGVVIDGLRVVEGVVAWVDKVRGAKGAVIDGLRRAEGDGLSGVVGVGVTPCWVSTPVRLATYAMNVEQCNARVLKHVYSHTLKLGTKRGGSFPCFFFLSGGSKLTLPGLCNYRAYYNVHDFTIQRILNTTQVWGVINFELGCTHYFLLNYTPQYRD